MGLVNLQMSYDLYSIPLSNVFIDEYMPYANPVFALVYITGLRHCYHSSVSFKANDEMTVSDLSKILGISENFVIEAWRHWESEGIVRLHETEENGVSVEFLAVETKQKKTKVKVAPQRRSRKIVIKENVPAEKAAPYVAKTKLQISDKPTYTPDEISLYTSRNKETKNLFKTAEQVLGKLLSHNDLTVIFGLYDWLRLPPDVIELLLNYCVSNEHRSLRYIEKVALDWSENEITTIDQAEDYIKTFNKDYREIMRSFGAARRDPTDKEIEFMKKWLKELEMPLEVLKEACERSLYQTGKANFKYADTIVKNWRESGIRTLEDIATVDNDRTKETEKKEERTSAKRGTKQTKNKFVNFESRDVDYSDIEKKERELLLKKLNEESYV